MTLNELTKQITAQGGDGNTVLFMSDGCPIVGVWIGNEKSVVYLSDNDWFDETSFDETSEDLNG